MARPEEPKPPGLPASAPSSGGLHQPADPPPEAAAPATARVYPSQLSLTGGPTPFDRQWQKPSAQLILLPAPDLEAMTRGLAASTARGVLCTLGLREDQVLALRAGLSRPLSVRRPLHPLLAPATTIHSRLVSDYRGKDYTVAEIGTWAGELGLSPRYCDALEQALDEMLLNALFAAPRTAGGTPRYSHFSAAERLTVRAPPDEQAVVRFAADPQRIVISVRDRFGALRASTVLGYLIRCAESQRLRKSPIEAKISGSGVGLFLITSSASELLFRLRRGRLTELVFALYRERPRPLRALIFDDDASLPRR
jgi:hypothetical protein